MLFILTLFIPNTSIEAKINEQFHLDNASNLTIEIFYYNFNKKILLNFLVKIVVKTRVKLDAFSR